MENNDFYRIAVCYGVNGTVHIIEIIRTLCILQFINFKYASEVLFPFS